MQHVKIDSSQIAVSFPVSAVGGWKQGKGCPLSFSGLTYGQPFYFVRSYVIIYHFSLITLVNQQQNILEILVVTL